MENIAAKFKRGPSRRKHTSSRWSGLQSRITISYALTTIGVVLLIEMLFMTTLIMALLYTPLANSETIAEARPTVKLYALEAAVQAQGSTLNPQTTFAPGHPFSIELTDNDTSNHLLVTYVSQRLPSSQLVAFALLITPDGRVLASSYPARYPVAAPVVQLLPDRSQMIRQALLGNSAQNMETTAQGRSLS